MIKDQNDHLFPSLSHLSRWYENQLIINTSYIKALVVHFGIKDIPVGILGQSSLFQLYVTGLQKPKVALPHRIVFEVKRESNASIPETKMEQDRRADLKVVDEEVVEEPIDKDIFDYDAQMSDDDIAAVSVLNLPKNKDFSDKEDTKKRISIVSLAEFYEAKIDIMGKISKGIMLMARCGRLELDWEISIEQTQEAQLHINYHLTEEKVIEKVELRLSEGHGPTSYGFIAKKEEPPAGSHLSIVR